MGQGASPRDERSRISVAVGGWGGALARVVISASRTQVGSPVAGAIVLSTQKPAPLRDDKEAGKPAGSKPAWCRRFHGGPVIATDRAEPRPLVRRHQGIQIAAVPYDLLKQPFGQVQIPPVTCLMKPGQDLVRQPVRRSALLAALSSLVAYGTGEAFHLAQAVGISAGRWIVFAGMECTPKGGSADWTQREEGFFCGELSTQSAAKPDNQTQDRPSCSGACAATEPKVAHLRGRRRTVLVREHRQAGGGHVRS